MKNPLAGRSPGQAARQGRAADGRLTGSPVLESARKFKNTHPIGRFVLPALALFLVLTFPIWAVENEPLNWFFVDQLGITMDTLFTMAVYVMLALGLNVVVGYAGLLDLGYVAFFALGAYTFCTARWMSCALCVIVASPALMRAQLPWIRGCRSGGS